AATPGAAIASQRTGRGRGRHTAAHELTRMSEPVAAPAPLWLRIGLTAFVAFLVPYYWRHYGPQTFLWLSDAGLFLTVIALWRADRLLISMMAIGVLPLELFWNIDFFSASSPAPASEASRIT